MLRTLVIAGALALACSASVAAEFGVASHYGLETCRRHKPCRTANMEPFPATDPNAVPTAAHRTLPFGTRVQLTTADGKHSCVLRINDRGPFIRGRVIDLSPSATKACGFTGNLRVRLDVLHN